MIISASILYVSEQPVLMCRVGTPARKVMAQLEEALQRYEKLRIPGARLVLLHAEDPRDAAKAALIYDLIKRFGTVAVFRQEERGFRVIHTRIGSVYKKYDIIPRNKLVAHPKPASEQKR